MKSVSQVYGLEKEAFARAGMAVANKGYNLFKSLRNLPKATAGKVLPALKRGGSNYMQALGKTEGTMGKVFLGGSGVAVVGGLPGVNLAPALGGKDSIANMFLNPKSMVAEKKIDFKSARNLVQKTNLGPYQSYVPMAKTGGANMYKHKQIIKQASAKGVARDALMYGLAGIGIGAGAPLATYGIGKGLKYLNRGSVNRDYNAVVKEDPSLKNDKAKKLYKVLHRTAPTVAREPVMASKVLANMMEIPQITPQTFADVLRLEKLYQETEMPFFGPKHQMKPGDIT